jgi:DNA-binding response OmpR family regulator
MEKGKGFMSTSIAPDRREQTAAAAKTCPQGRILLLDDETMLLDVLEEMLERLGFEVVVAATVKDALGELAEPTLPFRVAILDLTIPGGPGGLELVQPLRISSPGVFMIATSGSPTELPMLNPTDYGFDASLGKPYRLDELRRLLPTLTPT